MPANQRTVQVCLFIMAAIALFGGVLQMSLGQPDTTPRLDNVHRFLAGIYLGCGIIAAWAAVTVRQQGTLIYLIALGVVLGGHGPPHLDGQGRHPGAACALDRLCGLGVHSAADHRRGAPRAKRAGITSPKKSYPRSLNPHLSYRTLLTEGRHHEASWWRSRPEAGVEMRAQIRRPARAIRASLARRPRARFAATHPGGFGTRPGGTTAPVRGAR